MSESTSNAASPTTSPHRLVGRTQQCPANNTRCSKVDTNVVRQGLGRRHHRRLPVRPAGPYRPRDWPVPVRRPATAWGTGPTRNRAGPRYRSKIYALWYMWRVHIGSVMECSGYFLRKRALKVAPALVDGYFGLRF